MSSSAVVVAGPRTGDTRFAPEEAVRYPRLCFIGPMVGRNAGCITHQGEIVSDLFAQAGYPVISASALTNRYARAGDIVSTVIRQRRNIDLLVLQVYGERSFVVEDAASLIGQRLGLPMVMVAHGGTLPVFMAKFPRWSRRVFSRAQLIVTPSLFLARTFNQHGFEARVVPNVINLSSYPYRYRRSVSPKFFWMRAFYDYYNPMMAVRVLEGVRRMMPDATLTLAGPDAGLEGDVRRQVAEAGLDGCVRFPGFLDPSAKAREAGTADIFLNTTKIDNMPVAVLEACAMGLPVIATSVGGIPDLLTHDDTALLVPDGDAQAMMDAVYRLCHEPGLAARLSANGRRLAERSSWPSVQPLWEAVFQAASRPITRAHL